jgi:hypothetical protein
MQGWEGVDDFSKSRKDESKGTSIASDLFFGLGIDASRGRTAITKRSVNLVSVACSLLFINPLTPTCQMFENLKQDCSDYILDLLEYIQTDLLRVDNTKRARMEEIVQKFEKMNYKSQRNVDYCISRTPGRLVRRADSELSEIVEVPDLPGEDLIPDKSSMPIRAQRQSVSPAASEIRQSNITRIIDSRQTRSRSPFSRTSSILQSMVAQSPEEVPRQNGETNQSTMLGESSISQQVNNEIGIGPSLASRIGNTTSQTTPWTPIRSQTPSNDVGPHLRPGTHYQNAGEDDLAVNGAKPITSIPRLPNKVSIDNISAGSETRRIPPKDIAKHTSKLHDHPQGAHAGSITEFREPQGKSGQLRRAMHRRASKLLDWCFRENQSWGTFIPYLMSTRNLDLCRTSRTNIPSASILYAAFLRLPSTDPYGET